jgi:hypothetical protein
VLTACGKHDEQAAPAAASASASASPTTNAHQTTTTAADCDKLPDPKPADESAAGRATAVSQGIAARAACKKGVANQQNTANADLARIREIKEKEEAEHNAAKQSEEEWKRAARGSSKTPLKEFKY